jgi:two-component system, cell cycle response regulator DivK
VEEKRVEEAGSGIPKKILIVDDNADSRELVIKVLKQFGYRIVQAVDGEEALAKAVREMPDLILMDRSLPKMDGLEVTKKLKSLKEFIDVPIVALTAHAMRGDREKALAAGCVGYIPKPVNVRTLPEQIQFYLKGRGGSTSNAEK